MFKSGHAYRCFCSQDRLAETREKLARTGSNSTYDKACLNLTEEEVARRVRAGQKSIIRLNVSTMTSDRCSVPDSSSIELALVQDGRLPDRPFPKDIVFGHLKESHASLPTDPILLKSDAFPTYHLASVVDDHEMGITHVLRGEVSYPLPRLFRCITYRGAGVAPVTTLTLGLVRSAGPEATRIRSLAVTPES